MEGRIVNDFPVDTNGHCFLCLNKVLPQYDLHKLGSPSSQVSVHSLSQYLQMDMSKVFHEKDSIPSELLDDVKRSKMKVSLCEQCSKWNGRLSELFRQLEKIETEVTFYLALIHGNLMSSDENGNKDIFYMLGEDADSIIGSSEKLRITKTLRKEAKHRCSLKLKNIKPRVKVQNLTTNQVISKQESISFKSLKQHHLSLTSDDDNLARLGKDCCDAEQQRNERYDVDFGTDYFEDAAASVERGSSANRNEPDNPQASQIDNPMVTGDNLSNLAIKTEPGAGTINLKRKWNVEIVPKSPAKVLPSTYADKKVEKLTYAINPSTGKFKCNICSVESTRRGNLKKHYESVHLKIKHRCNLCGKEFAQSSSYNLHHRTAHVGVRFKCNLCGKCFTQRYALINHQLKVGSCTK